MPNTQTGKGQFGARRRPKTESKAAKNLNGAGARDKHPDGHRPVPVSPAQARNEPAYINAEALNATKYGSYATAVLAALSAVPVFVKALGIQNISNSIVYGAFALAAVCVVAVAVLIRTDLQTRGAAKVAALESQHAPQSAQDNEEGGFGQDEEIPDEDDTVYEPPAATVWTAGNLAIKLRDDERRYLGLAVGWNPKTGNPAYLISKRGEKPRWVDDAKVHTAFYESNSTPVDPMPVESTIGG